MSPPSETDEDDAAVSAFLDASRALIGIAVHSVHAVPGELTVTQYRLLAVVAAEGPLTISHVARQLGVAQSNATRLCDRLQRLRFLERNRSAADRRVVLVDVTAAGREVVDVATEVRRRQIRLVLGAMSPPARQRALRGVAEFNRAAGALEEHPWLRAAW